MSDFVFNIAKGKIASLAALPLTNDALILVLVKASGLETDATLKDYDDLSSLLAGTSNECDFSGYTRKTLTTVSVTVDDSNDRTNIDADDPSAYTNADASQAAGKAIIVYDPDTTTGSDSTLVPLFAYDCAVSFDTGVATTIQFNASGIGRAS